MRLLAEESDHLFEGVSFDDCFFLVESVSSLEDAAVDLSLYMVELTAPHELRNLRLLALLSLMMTFVLD